MAGKSIPIGNSARRQVTGDYERKRERLLPAESDGALVRLGICISDSRNTEQYRRAHCRENATVQFIQNGVVRYMETAAELYCIVAVL